MKKTVVAILLPVLFILSGAGLRAQELNCTVTIISPTIQQSPIFKSTLNTLQNAIRDFINGKSWTGEVYQAGEKIDCQMLVTISSYSAADNSFNGTIQVTSNRPVYGSTYNLGVLNILDKNFGFKYVEFQALDYVDGTYMNDLTSILAFYSYIIIGADYDTYVEYGGTPAYNKAMSIVNSGQTSSITGWKSGEKVTNNRYQLANELADDRFGKIFRKALYDYHRQGFDVMAQDVEKGRESVANSLASLEDIYKANPFAYLLQIFFFTKKEELMAAFAQSSTSQKTKVSALCQEMDPGNASKYADRLRP